MRLVSAARSRLASERGFSLIELMVTILILGLVLGAVISVSVTAQSSAAKDNERNRVAGAANTAMYSISTALRQATLIHLASGDESCPATSSPANCIDFNMPARTQIVRDGSGNITSIQRGTWRVRIDCSTGTCFQSRSADPATAPTGTPTRLVTSVTNAGVTAPGGTIPPVFDYVATAPAVSPTWTSATLAFGTPNRTGPPPYWINVTLRVARRGDRVKGLNGNIFLQDAVGLRNLSPDSSPCSNVTGTQVAPVAVGAC